MGFHRTREGTEEEEDVVPGRPGAVGEGGAAVAWAASWTVGNKGGETDQGPDPGSSYKCVLSGL